MARPELLLLLMMLSMCLARDDEELAESLRLVCSGHVSPSVAVQAEWCPRPPCTTSPKDLTLALPVLLTLHGWSTELWLFNATGHGGGVARLRLDEATASLDAASCIGERHKTSVTCTSEALITAAHVEVVVVRQVVGLKLLPCRHAKDGPVTLHYEDNPALLPSAVMVLHSQRFGYSAVNPVEQLPVVVVAGTITALTALCVVLSAAILVLAWRAWSSVVAVHGRAEGKAEAKTTNRNNKNTEPTQRQQ